MTQQTQIGVGQANSWNMQHRGPSIGPLDVNALAAMMESDEDRAIFLFLPKGEPNGMSFNGYRTKDGKLVQHVRDGTKIPFQVRFMDRFYVVNKSDPLYKFMRESPYCQGSELSGSGANAWFKEFVPGQETRNALSAERTDIAVRTAIMDAQHDILSLAQARFNLGYSGKDPDQIRSVLLQMWAGGYPSDRDRIYRLFLGKESSDPYDKVCETAIHRKYIIILANGTYKYGSFELGKSLEEVKVFFRKPENANLFGVLASDLGVELPKEFFKIKKQ